MMSMQSQMISQAPPHPVDTGTLFSEPVAVLGGRSHMSGGRLHRNPLGTRNGRRRKRMGGDEIIVSAKFPRLQFRRHEIVTDDRSTMQPPTKFIQDARDWQPLTQPVRFQRPDFRKTVPESRGQRVLWDDQEVISTKKSRKFLIPVTSILENVNKLLAKDGQATVQGIQLIANLMGRLPPWADRTPQQIEQINAVLQRLGRALAPNEAASFAEEKDRREELASFGLKPEREDFPSLSLSPIRGPSEFAARTKSESFSLMESPTISPRATRDGALSTDSEQSSVATPSVSMANIRARMRRISGHDDDRKEPARRPSMGPIIAQSRATESLRLELQKAEQVRDQLENVTGVDMGNLSVAEIQALDEEGKHDDDPDGADDDSDPQGLRAAEDATSSFIPSDVSLDMQAREDELKREDEVVDYTVSGSVAQQTFHAEGVFMKNKASNFVRFTYFDGSMHFSRAAQTAADNAFNLYAMSRTHEGRTPHLHFQNVDGDWITTGAMLDALREGGTLNITTRRLMDVHAVGELEISTEGERRAREQREADDEVIALDRAEDEEDRMDEIRSLRMDLGAERGAFAPDADDLSRTTPEQRRERRALRALRAKGTQARKDRNPRF